MQSGNPAPECNKRICLVETRVETHKSSIHDALPRYTSISRYETIGTLRSTTRSARRRALKQRYLSYETKTKNNL